MKRKKNKLLEEQRIMISKIKAIPFKDKLPDGIKQLLGVFILDINGNLYTSEKWDTSNNDNAVGVAVYSEKCRFCINTERSSILAWQSATSLVLNIVTTETYADAIEDYDGEGNTDKILEQSGSEIALAAAYCRGTIFKNGKQGYLGSAGEWSVILQNVTEINTCMNLLGGITINNSLLVWTSTQVNENQSWYKGTSGITTSNKTSARRNVALCKID